MFQQTKILIAVLLIYLANKTMFAQVTTDTIISAYAEKSTSFWYTNIDSAIYYANLGLKRAEKYNDLAAISEVLNYLGTAYELKGETMKAISEHEKSLAIALKLNNKELISGANYYLGQSYLSKKIYDKAMHHFDASLKADIEIGDTNGIATNHLHIGYVYRDLKNQEKAKQRFLIAQKFFEALNNTDGIASVQLQLAAIAKAEKKYGLAKSYFQKSLKLHQMMQDEHGIAIIYTHFSVLFAETNSFDSSLNYANKAIDLFKKTSEIKNFCIAMLSKANAHLALNQLGNAKSYTEEIKSSQCFETDLDYRKKTYILLEKIALKESNLPKALQYKQFVLELTDSIYNFERLRLQEEMLVRHEMNQQLDLMNKLATERDKQKESLNYQKIGISFLIVVVLILVLLIGLNLNKSNRLSNANRELQLRSNRILEQKEAISILVNELQMANQNEIEKSKELETANQTKSKLLAIISHDFRGPLVQLKSIIQLLQTKQLNQIEAEKSLLSIGETVNVTLNFLDNLLYWAKYQLSGIKVNQTPIELNTLILESIELIMPQANNKQIKVLSDLSNTPLPAFADYDMLLLVVRNILSNAVKFSSIESEIMIKTAQFQTYNFIAIIDNGPGIDQQKLKKMFKGGYFNTNNSRSEKSTGLGMMLSYDFITLNGGLIGANSQIGSGTTFWIKMPIYNQNKNQNT